MAVGQAGAADIVVPPSEAPTEIFSASLGDAEVDLSLLGSWTAGVSLGTGLLWAPGQPVQLLDAFPSLDLGFLFSQTPDVTISLRMLKRYFLDVSVLGSFSDNAIVLGYDGQPGEALQSVRVGTAGIEQEPSEFLQVPSQAASSIGVSARLAAGSGVNDVLLRWDSTGSRSRVFLGKNELAEEVHAPDSYIRGRFFFLPDMGVQDLEVLLEEEGGTIADAVGRRYRRAGFDDVILDSTQGLVSIRVAWAGRMLVFYRKGGAAVGTTVGGTLPDDSGGKRDPTVSIPFSWTMGSYLGQDMADRKVSVPGSGDFLLLWEPGDSSPFEVCNTYGFSGAPPADVSRISFGLVQKPEGASLASDLVYLADPANRRFSVLVDRDPTGPNRFENFYPFADPTGLLYGPARDSLAGQLDYEIAAQFLTPLDSYVLESDIVPGSVQVTVNGVTETRFEVDASSGTLVLLFDVRPTDRIEVRWRKASAGLSGGDILLTWRDRIPLSQSITLDLSAGLRWNADPWSYSPEPYARSGTLIAAVGLRGTGKDLDWSVQAGAAFTNPDTTGILRLFGMEGHSLGIDLSEEAAYPASPPDASSIPGLGQANRGELLYRDYRQYGALGSASLQAIDWAGAPAALPYADGSRMGPYNVLGTSTSSSGTSLVMDFGLQIGQWAGAQLPVAGGADVDLSDARSITVRVKAQDVAAGSDFQLHLQLGGLGEDLDGDSAMDVELSSTVAGFSFDPAAQPALKVGAGPTLEGNGIRDTEDRNANEILDQEQAARVVTVSPTALHFNGDAAWQTVTYALSTAERALLQSTRGVRLVVTAAALSTGRLVIDSLSIEKSPFWVENASGGPTGTLSAREAPEGLLGGNDPGTGSRLEDSFPEVITRFHSGVQAQEVLELKWQGVGVDGARLAGYAAQGTGGIAYDSIVLYLRAAAPMDTGATLSFQLSDSDGQGVLWSFSGAEVPDTLWHELRVSRTGLSVSVDGVEIPATVTWDSSSGDLAHLILEVSDGLGLSDGSLILDEIHCVDPRSAVGAALLGDLSARFPGTILKAGNLPLLANVSIDQHLSFATRGFSPLYGIPLSAEELTSRTKLGAEILFAQVEADILLRHHDGVFGAYGAHRVTIPTTSIPVSYTDSFSLTPAGDFSRENLLDVRPLPAVSVQVSSRADAVEERLSQAWVASTSLLPLPALSLFSQLEVSQTLTGYTAAQDWYGARWLRGYELIAPWAGGDDDARGEKLSARLLFQPESTERAPWEAELSASTAAAASAYSTLGRTQQNDLAMAARLLYRFLDGEVTAASLGMRYARALTLTTLEGPGTRFTAETAAWAGALAPQGYILTGIPFFEILADESGSILPLWPATLVSGTYNPSATITFQRNYGSRLRDLLIPSLVEVAVERQIDKTADLTRSALSITPRLATRAANIFGRMGSTPVLPFFRTDEYSVGLSAVMEEVAGESLQLSKLAADAYAALYGFQGEEVTLVESLRREEADAVTLSSQTQLLYDWSFRPAAGVPFRFLPAEVGASGYFSHRESAQLTVQWQDEGAYHPVSLLLGHATTLLYPERGFLKASASIGVDVESLTGGSYAYRFAVKLGLEANLTF